MKAQITTDFIICYIYIFMQGGMRFDINPIVHSIYLQLHIPWLLFPATQAL